jgi:hypothetical protein
LLGMCEWFVFFLIGVAVILAGAGGARTGIGRASEVAILFRATAVWQRQTASAFGPENPCVGNLVKSCMQFSTPTADGARKCCYVEHSRKAERSGEGGFRGLPDH